MNAAELKLDLFRRIDSLPEEIFIEIQKPILDILIHASDNIAERTTHKNLKELFRQPFPVDKIQIMNREEIYERKSIY
ncbi:MAG: hypothetical protein H7A25_12945 [Leptospiraceae bacterium]|nr:hypothetical protein [Leptospiraceae bacterium]MCP5500807.1 hypothetical protein [Leptospiraceae bacterium]